MKNCVDLKMKQNKNGVFDLAICDGGLTIDETEATSISSSLFTDSFVKTYNADQRRGGVGIFFGNTAWTQILHARGGDEEALNFIKNEFERTLERDFGQNETIEILSLDVQYFLNTLYILIEVLNLETKTKHTFNYKLGDSK